MWSQGQMHRRWGTLLVLVIVMLVAIMPMLEPVCDTGSGDGYDSSHIHATPAVAAQGPAIPAIPLVGPVPPGRSIEPLTALAPSIFVPPRS